MFFKSPKNIPNHYPDHEIWKSCWLLLAGNSNFRIVIWNMFLEIWQTHHTFWKKTPLEFAHLNYTDKYGLISEGIFNLVPFLKKMNKITVPQYQQEHVFFWPQTFINISNGNNFLIWKGFNNIYQFVEHVISTSPCLWESSIIIVKRQLLGAKQQYYTILLILGKYKKGKEIDRFFCNSFIISWVLLIYN